MGSPRPMRWGAALLVAVLLPLSARAQATPLASCEHVDYSTLTWNAIPANVPPGSGGYYKTADGGFVLGSWGYQQYDPNSGMTQAAWAQSQLNYMTCAADGSSLPIIRDVSGGSGGGTYTPDFTNSNQLFEYGFSLVLFFFVTGVIVGAILSLIGKGE